MLTQKYQDCLSTIICLLRTSYYRCTNKLKKLLFCLLIVVASILDWMCPSHTLKLQANPNWDLHWEEGHKYTTRQPTSTIYIAEGFFCLLYIYTWLLSPSTPTSSPKSQIFYLPSSSWFDKSSTAQFSELEVHFWTSELSFQRSYHYTRILSTKYKYLVEAYGEDAGGGVVGQGQVHGAPQLLGLTAGARRRRLQQTSWWRRCFRKIVSDCEESGREKER